ncbi:MAG: ATP-binding protein [Lachnospiraceae bacterium]
MRRIKAFFTFAFLLGCLYFIIGYLFLPADTPSRGFRCEELQADWSMVTEDNQKIPVQPPVKCDVPRGTPFTVETILPDQIDQDSYLCFQSLKQDISIYIDGTLRQCYSTEDTRLFGCTTASLYVFLKLSPSDAGKKLTFTAVTDSPYSGVFRTVYYGNRMGIWHFFFQQCGTELIIAFLTLFLGICVIAVSLISRFIYHRKIDLEYLCWGIILAAAWLINNSIFRQLMFPSISVISDLTFYIIMLLPFPFLFYLNGIQKERYQKVYFVVSLIDLLNLTLCTLLHTTHIKDLEDTFPLIAITCFLSILTIIGAIIADAVRGYLKEYPVVAVGMAGVCAAACLQILRYFKREAFFNGATIAVGLIFLLICSIISTARQLLQIEDKRKTAEISSKTKAEFLAKVSHELRTPINAVLGMDAMILRECEDGAIKEYALDIQNAGQTLLTLVNDILDSSKIESGKMEILPASYDFSSMIHDIVNMISIKAHSKGLKLNVSVDQMLPSGLYGDEIRIRQVLVNLLSNAVKYTEEGSISFRITGECHEEKVLLHFSVEDTGIGIREEDLPKLFEEFERIDEYRNRSIEGTGLGMSITAQLLSMMGSKLQVESVYEKGSKFSFSLEQGIVEQEPIGDLEERIRRMATEWNYKAPFIAPGASILMVDDNAINRKVFSSLLKALKISTDTVDSGEKCLEVITEKHYDLIFLDHMMPGMDGIETLHRIKDTKNHYCTDTPVIALTANAVTGAKEMYLAEGFDNFLSKPIITEKLEHMIKIMLPKELILDTPSNPPGKATMLSDAETEVSNPSDPKDDVLFMELPEIEGIDFAYALTHLGNEKILWETLDNFYRLIETDTAELESYYHSILHSDSLSEEALQTALEAYRIKAHAMKGSAAMIGALWLAGSARILEYAARDRKLDQIISLTPDFIAEWRSYHDKLSICMKKTPKIPVDNYNTILSYLDALAPAMEDMDLDTLDETMDQLNRYSYPEELEALMEQLDTAIANLEDASLNQLLTDIRAMISSFL